MYYPRKPPPRHPAAPRYRVYFLGILFFLVLGFLSRPPPSTPTQGFHLVIAYESIPHQTDGAERYLSSIVRAFSALTTPILDVTFIARNTDGKCKGSVDDVAGLGRVPAREATPTSPEFARLMSIPRTALLLPLSFFESCSGPAFNASSESYAAALRGLQHAAGCHHSGRRGGPSGSGSNSVCSVPLAVFGFDAQAARAQGLSENDPYPASAAAFRAAAVWMRAREEALYSQADVFIMLTAEDLAATPPTRPGVPRMVVGFKDDVNPMLRQQHPSGISSGSTTTGTGVGEISGGSSGGSGRGDSQDFLPLTPLERARIMASTIPTWASRSGFLFMGGGNNPTNQLALHAFLTNVWPRVRKALPTAVLHVVGSHPTALCKAHGVWCGWTAGTPYEGSGASGASSTSASAAGAAGGGAGEAEGGGGGVIVHGMVEEPSQLLASVRVALAPLVCGTGINTKVGYYMNAGLPVLGTAKAARGYGVGGAGSADSPGLVALASGVGEAMAEEALRLHEREEDWGVASLGALTLTAQLDDERSSLKDVAAVAQALGGLLERAGGA